MTKTVQSEISEPGKVLRIRLTDDLEILWVAVMQKRDECPVRDFVNGDYFTLQFVNTGRLHLMIGGELVVASEGQAVLIWPNEECRGMEPMDGELMCQWLRFRVHQSRSRRGQEVIEVPRHGTVPNPGRTAELFRLIGEEFHACRHYQRVDELPPCSQPSRFLLLSLLSRLGLAEPEHPLAPNALVALAERGKDYIRSNRHLPISSADVARALDCSPRYLRKAFQHAYGYSPLTFLLQTRLFEARRLLVETHLSVTEIARDCGFGSLNYFTRAFKGFHGVTPTEYRVQHSHRYVSPSF